MNQRDKTEFTKLIGDALNEVVVPALEDMEGRITKRIDSLEEDVSDLKTGVNALNRKFDSQQDRIDRHDIKISTLEKTLAVD